VDDLDWVHGVADALLSIARDLADIYTHAHTHTDTHTNADTDRQTERHRNIAFVA